LLNRAQKIYKMLGVNNCNDLHITPKPKGMHWRTYEKLVDEAQAFELESLYTMSQKLKNMCNFIHE
jgi:hypothetical protein